MDKLRVAVVGVGSIAQVAHLPTLKKIENIELVAICDVDESKITPLLKKFDIPSWYSQIDRMFRKEKLDIVHICTSNHYHYPMAYLALNSGINVLLEKPIALNAVEAEKLAATAKAKKLEILIGMQNRFRDDVLILKDFIEKDELGEIFYIKSGWLKQWSRKSLGSWQTNKKISGGGVLLDLGVQLIDLAMFISGMPEIESVRLYDYTINPDIKVEDSALAVIQTKSGSSITIEISWRMHVEKDMIYTHFFGSKGAAYLNPLRINKELHGNLVNVTPVSEESSSTRFKKAYQNEIMHFTRVVSGEEKNQSPASDAVKIMRIIDALYESGRTKQQVRLSN